MSDERLILTADEAIGCLPDSEYVHNTTGGMIMIGIDVLRADAEQSLRDAIQIEIGGPMCMAMRHPLVTWDTPRHCTFFEADMDRVNALVAAKTVALPSPSGETP